MPEPPIKIETHRVPNLLVRQRLQEYAVGIFNTIVSRKGVKKAIKNGLVFVNSEVGQTSHWIVGGEEISLYQASQHKKPTIELDLKVLYEDDHLAIVYKPAGMLVSGNKRFTVENALATNLKKSNELDALLRPEPIHRLDYPTTGALLIGKTGAAVIALNRLFEKREIIKIYYAVAIKAINDEGALSNPIDGKEALSMYQKIAELDSLKYEKLNLLKLTPHTGRRHQLRKHLSELGNPLFGDDVYGHEGLVLRGRGLYLHARSLEFTHPITRKEIKVTAPFPKKFVQLFPEILAT